MSWTSPAQQAEAIFAALGGRRAPDGYMVRCPAHADRNPSLHVTVTPDRVLVRCHAGCDQERVIETLREMRLWPDEPQETREKGVIWTYTDEEGRPVHRVKRAPGKRFTQERYERGQWIAGLARAKRYLYQLPSLLASDPAAPVWIAEGEKDADTLRRLGCVATTNAAGAKGWDRSYNTWLQDRDVILAEDNDDAGRARTAMLAAALKGTARRISVCRFADLPEGGDVSDFLAQGGTLEQLLARVTPIDRHRGQGEVFSLADLLAEHIPPARWAVRDLLPEGLTLFAGKAKMGKSWLALGLCMAVASGGRALGQIPVEAGPVLYVALEDSKRRLQARSQHLTERETAAERLFFTLSWPRLDEGGIDELDAWIRKRPDARLIVIDTLKKVRPIVRQDRSIYDLDYEALQGLQELAARHHIAVLVVHHLRKMVADDPLDAISGTTGLAAATDGAWVLQRTRGEHDGVLHVIHREGEDQELALTWDAEMTLWSIAGPAADYQLTKERKEILDLILEAGEPMTPRDVAEALDKNRYTTKNLMRKMTVDGVLTVLTQGRYKVSSDYALQSIGDGNAKNRSPRSPEADLPQQQAKTADYGGSDSRSPTVVQRSPLNNNWTTRTTADYGPDYAQKSDFSPIQATNTLSDYGDYGGSVGDPALDDKLEDIAPWDR